MPTCKGLRQEFIDCILESDCYLKYKRPLKECLQISSTTESSTVSAPIADDDTPVSSRPAFPTNDELIDRRFAQENSQSNNQHQSSGDAIADKNVDGVPDKCRQLFKAHQVCVRGLVTFIFLLETFTI